MVKFIWLTTTALLLSACGNNDNSSAAPPDTNGGDGVVAADAAPPAATPATRAAPTDAVGYIANAGAGDLWEIESSKALLAKSANTDVKKFAQMMIDNHGQSTAKVKAAATAAKIEVPAPALDADQQQMLDEIKKADAATIDAVYLGHQQTAHDAALALHQGYSTLGDTDSLKKAASEIVPVVEAHRTELRKLSARP
ncbi:MAG: DUF4142 domain-containing protein [Sphingopyxis sp.]|uniref:DUF4142 domain-containing protein n=1 Tax=Sphingopyxis sp. TaxID=1908224 RepID=UPI003D810761